MRQWQSATVDVQRGTQMVPRFTISAKHRRNFRNITFFAEARKSFITVKIFQLNLSSALKLHQTTLK
jgi:hypothetical protein